MCNCNGFPKLYIRYTSLQNWVCICKLSSQWMNGITLIQSFRFPMNKLHDNIQISEDPSVVRKDLFMLHSSHWYRFRFDSGLFFSNKNVKATISSNALKLVHVVVVSSTFLANDSIPHTQKIAFHSSLSCWMAWHKIRKTRSCYRDNVYSWMTNQLMSSKQKLRKNQFRD